jgi:hypothetical protein
MEINGAQGYHQRSIRAPGFKGEEKSLELVLFSLLRSRSVRCKVEAP